MRVAVVGLGAIGMRHLRNLRDMGVYCCGVEPHDGRAEIGRRIAPVARSFDALAVTPDAVIVCTPAPTHGIIASHALQRGADVLIEKPLTTSASDARRIVALSGGRVVGVGYNLRFDPGLRDLRRRMADFRPTWARVEFGYRLSRWRLGDYRDSVSARRESGGGVLYEASHELDLVRWLFGEWVSVSAVLRRLSSLDVDVEDTALAVIETAQGVVVELHLDFTRLNYRRRIEAINAQGQSVEWDLDRSTVDATYRAEMADFLAACEGDMQPESSLEDGVAAMELDAAIRLSYATGKRIEHAEVGDLAKRMWGAA